MAKAEVCKTSIPRFESGRRLQSSPRRAGGIDSPAEPGSKSRGVRRDALGLYSLDILSRLGEAFVFENIEWDELIVDGIRVRVATPRMLRMKKDTERPLDRIDAEAIRERFGLPEND